MRGSLFDLVLYLFDYLVMDRGVLFDFTMTLLRKTNFVIGQLEELTFGCMLSYTWPCESSGQRPLDSQGLI